MKLLSHVTGGLLLLGILASPAFVFAKEKNGGQNHAAKHGAPHPSKPERSAKQSQWLKDEGWHKQAGWKGNDTWRDSRAVNWKKEHYTWVQRGGYGGYYVSKPHYESYFGPGHVFRIRERPVMYRGYPRFNHQGYNFLLVDPYPETWEESWYSTDDVYIVHDNGYYLYNRTRPGHPLAVTIIR
jgi:hypothetical protein